MLITPARKFICLQIFILQPLMMVKIQYPFENFPSLSAPPKKNSSTLDIFNSHGKYSFRSFKCSVGWSVY